MVSATGEISGALCADTDEPAHSTRPSSHGDWKQWIGSEDTADASFDGFDPTAPSEKDGEGAGFETRDSSTQFLSPSTLSLNEPRSSLESGGRYQSDEDIRIASPTAALLNPSLLDGATLGSLTSLDSGPRSSLDSTRGISCSYPNAVVSPKSKDLPSKRARIKPSRIITDGKGIKKAAHNLVEKRYRLNLNDRIAALRDSVPSLRAKAPSSEAHGNRRHDAEDSSNTHPALGLRKGEVLTEAIQYIAELETRVQKLGDENKALRIRMAASEHMEPHSVCGDASSDGVHELAEEAIPSLEIQRPSDSITAVQGLIKVPENMRKLRANLPTLHYVDQSVQPGDNDDAQVRRNQSYMRLRVGSLAGLL